MRVGAADEPQPVAHAQRGLHRPGASLLRNAPLAADLHQPLVAIVALRPVHPAHRLGVVGDGQGFLAALGQPLPEGLGAPGLAVPVVERAVVATIVDVAVAAVPARRLVGHQGDKLSRLVPAIAGIHELPPDAVGHLKAPVIVVGRRTEIQAGHVAAPAKELVRGAGAHAVPHLGVQFPEIDGAVRQPAHADGIRTPGKARRAVHDDDAPHSLLVGGRHRERGAPGPPVAGKGYGAGRAQPLIGEDINSAVIAGSRVAAVDVHRQDPGGKGLARSHRTGSQDPKAIGVRADHPHRRMRRRAEVLAVSLQVDADGQDGHLGVLLRLEEVAISGAQDQAHHVAGHQGALDDHHVDEVLDAPIGGLQGERHGGVRALYIGVGAIAWLHLLAVPDVADAPSEGVAQVGVPGGGHLHGQVPAGRDAQSGAQPQANGKGVATVRLDDVRLDGAVQVGRRQKLPRALGVRHPVAHLFVSPGAGSG